MMLLVIPNGNEESSMHLARSNHERFITNQNCLKAAELVKIILTAVKQSYRTFYILENQMSFSCVYVFYFYKIYIKIVFWTLRKILMINYF